MRAIGDFGAWVWDRIVAIARVANQALAQPSTVTDGFLGSHDDTVFQRRDIIAAGKASERKTR